MDDLDSAINSVANIAPSRAITALDDDPDDAAKSLQLSRSTGVPASLIHGDLDAFVQEQKVAATANVVRGNSLISDYINKNPLAESISNDDYHNLDEFSKTHPWLSTVSRVLHGLDDPEIVKQGFRSGGSAALESFIADPDPNWDQLKTNLGYQAIGLVIRTMKAGMAGVQKGVGGAAEQAITGISGDKYEGQRAGREFEALIESEFARRGSEIVPHANTPAKQFSETLRESAVERRKAAIEQNNQLNDALFEVRAWTDNGLEPPHGVHPLIDKIKGDANKEYIDALDEKLKAAQLSLTKDRDSEYFKKFVDEEFGDSTMHIAGNRVAELYGDKIPSPDDNLLGWVPGIAEKLESARLGDDVSVPIKDWLSKVDPALAKDLHDDLRAWPGGITATEAKEPWEPKPVVDAPMAQVRSAMGLEPAFSIGDRKLTLKAIEHQYDPSWNEYHLLDQNGKPIGELSILPDAAKKELYVGNINGLAGLYSNSFGPSLIRDIKRQLKEIYPEFEWLTGHRVSGAREVAGVTDDLSKSFVRIALSIPDDVDTYQKAKALLADSYTYRYDHGIEGYVLPKKFFTDHELELNTAVRDELAAIAPTADYTGTAGISYPGTGRVEGVYLSHPRPEILIDLLGNDPLGTARHEAIHHLWRAGLFSEEEWGALLKASMDENWIGRYHIDRRYADFDPHAQHEEAIAEAYRDWAATKDTVEHPNTPVTRAFQKIWEFLQRIKQRFAEILGKEPSANELFEKVHSGEIGHRGLEGEADYQAAAQPAFSISDHLDNLRAEVAGLDKKHAKILNELTEKQHQEDVEAAVKRTEREQRQQQTKEWKANYVNVRKEVETSIRQRPDVAADLLVGSGEYNGQRLRQVYPLKADDLTEEQKAELPKRYYSKDGLPVDGVARMVGYTSGDAMIEKLIEYNQAKGDLSPQEMLRKTIDEETQRQMEAKYGKLENNIMREAQDQALSETNLNRIAEELQGAAMKAGVSVIDKNLAIAESQRLFNAKKVGDVSSDTLRNVVARHSRLAERAMIDQDWATATIHLQNKYIATLGVVEAAKFEKERLADDKLAKQYAKTDRAVKSTEAEYVNYIQQILNQTGRKTDRGILDITKEIWASESKTLEKFVAQKLAEGRSLPVWDQLYDPNWRANIDEMSVDEYRDMANSIRTLAHNGKLERKVIRAGEEFELSDVKQQLKDTIEEYIDKAIGYDAKGYRTTGIFRGSIGRAVLNFGVSNLQWETVLNRWDGFTSKGPWFQYFQRELIDGNNQRDAWKKEFAKKLQALPEPDNLTRTVNNPIFKQPDSDVLMQFTRENLIAVMLNTGTDSNLVKMAKGYGLDPGQVMDWVHQHATKEDWKFVQGIWNDIFAEIKKKSDTMERSLSGVATKDVQGRTIDTAFGNIQGGYYPVIWHSTFEGASKKLMGGNLDKDGPLFGGDYVRAATPQGHTKERTGYIAPMALDLDAMPGRISQMLHDIALRPAVINASKIAYDKDIRATITKNAGVEYTDELIPYLRNVAGAGNYMSKAQSQGKQISEFFRLNLIGTLIGLNPGTVLKHGPTAAVMSMREVGPMDFLHEVRGLFSINESTGDTNFRFAMNTSLELQRRDRNWSESLFGANDALTAGSGYTSLRQKIMQLSSKPVALSDLASAVPTWLARYKKEMADGATHGDAVSEADRAVRRAHGSTASTSRTGVMRTWSPWFTSVYNFFSDVMNRQAEMIWKAGEALDLVKAGEREEAMSKVPGLVASAFAFVIFPAIIENAVAPTDNDPKASWTKKAAKGLAFSLGSSWPGVRDLSSAVLSGHDPQAGLLGTAGKELTDVVRDALKDHPMAKDHAGKLLQDSIGLAGLFTGIPQQPAKSIRYLHDVNVGIEHPKGPWSWMTGLRFGKTKGHSTTFDNYLKGINR